MSEQRTQNRDTGTQSLPFLPLVMICCACGKLSHQRIVGDCIAFTEIIALDLAASQAIREKKRKKAGELTASYSVLDTVDLVPLR